MEKKILEYSIYHYNLNTETNLPGLKFGFPIPDFFIQKDKFNLHDISEAINNILVKKIKRLDDSYLMCSGGIDSSLILSYLKENNKKFTAINTYYPNHKHNDLSKISSLKKFYNFKLRYIKVSHQEYFKGLRYNWKNHYYGNTYSPTLFYTINKLSKKKYLITGSGPDELFYGMEKYKPNTFIKKNKIKKNLEKIDYSYNLNTYKKILNKNGLNILDEILYTRKALYFKISEISENLLNAQRILSYCTVTNQHMQMFSKAAKLNKMIHCAPFLDKKIIKLAFQTDINIFLDQKLFDMNKIECGKKILKDILERKTNKSHVKLKKVGFHAPVSKFFMQNNELTNFYKNLNLEVVENIFNIDKLRLKLSKYKLKKNHKDYFYFSFINVYQQLLNKNNYEKKQNKIFTKNS